MQRHRFYLTTSLLAVPMMTQKLNLNNSLTLFFKFFTLAKEVFIHTNVLLLFYKFQICIDLHSILEFPERVCLNTRFIPIYIY